jgi:hypothetical protein
MTMLLQHGGFGFEESDQAPLEITCRFLPAQFMEIRLSWIPARA